MKKLKDCKPGDEVVLSKWNTKPYPVPVVKVGRTLIHVNVAANAGGERIEQFRIDTGQLNNCRTGTPPSVRTEDEVAEAEHRKGVERQLRDLGVSFTAQLAVPTWRLEAVLSAMLAEPPAKQ